MPESAPAAVTDWRDAANSLRARWDREAAPRSAIADVLSRLSYGAVYGHLGLRLEGSYRKGPCPFCARGQRRFSVHVRHLGWRCHSCGRSGSALAFLNGGRKPTGPEMERALRKARALAAGHRVGLPRAAKAAEDREDRRRRKLDRKGARLLARAAVPLPRSPGHRYLSRRRLWPRRLAPEALGSLDLLWVPAAAVRAVLRWPRKAYPDPDLWAGCLGFPYRSRKGRLRAVKLEALDGRGRPLPAVGETGRWRRNKGAHGGLVFRPLNLPGGRVHAAEGELTALALALRCLARERGTALAFGGHAAMEAGADALTKDPRPVRLWPDMDIPGTRAAVRLGTALENAGLTVRLPAASLRPDGAGRDAADVLEAHVRRLQKRAKRKGLRSRTAEVWVWQRVFRDFRAGP